MNIEMLAVNIAVISLIFVPYFILIYIGQLEYNKINKVFEEEANRRGLSIDTKDRWNLNAIGIDHKQQKLLFVQRRNEEFFVEVINLHSVRQCQISAHHHNSKINGVDELVLQKLDLELLALNSNDISIICLFNSELTFDQDYEMKHAENWNRIINSSLSLNPTIRKVA